MVRTQKLMWRNIMRPTKSQKASVLHYIINLLHWNKLFYSICNNNHKSLLNPIVYSDSCYPLQTHCESSHERVWPFLINVYYFMSTRKQSIEEETTIFNYFITLNQTSWHRCNYYRHYRTINPSASASVLTFIYACVGSIQKFSQTNLTSLRWWHVR